MGQGENDAIDAQRARKRVLADASGHVLARAIHVAVELGLAERIGEGGRSAGDLAGAIGSHERSLYRLLHFLARHGYMRESPDGVFALTVLGRLLRKDAPDHTAAVVASLGHCGVWKSVSALDQVIRTGLPPEHRRDRPLYEFQPPAEHDRSFAEAMLGYHAPEPQQVATFYDFSASRVVVDVGGSSGRLLSTILAAYPHLRGVLLDRPGLAEEARQVFAAAGVGERCAFVAGSFFDSVPAGGDTYLLSHVLHDWPDDEAHQILACCRRAMDRHDKLLIVENLLSSDAENEDELPADMLLLMNTFGGLRTVAEYEVLLQLAGFDGGTLHACGPTVSVIEARPAP